MAAADKPDLLKSRTVPELTSGMRMYLIVAALILTVPLWARFIPGDVIHMDITNVMVLAGIYSCAVVGLNLLIGYAGQVSLGHSAFMGIGAYSVAILCTTFKWFPTWLGIIVGVLLSGVIGLLVGVPVLRLKGHYLALATLGLGEIAFILFRQMIDLTKGTVGITSIPPLSMFGFQFNSDLKQYYLVWVIVLLLLLFTINIVRSRVGRSLRALHSSEVAADAMGVNTARYKTYVFVLSAMFAGLAGALFALRQLYVNPESFTLTLSILLVTMVVVGGMGNLYGGIVGAIVLTFLPEVIKALPSFEKFNNYNLVLYGLLLIVFMIFWPRGIAYGLERGADLTSRGARHLHDRYRSRRIEGHSKDERDE